jgi:stalled ribosome rescue protein Dom34
MTAIPMARSHVCVWIDHREARIFGVGVAPSEEEVLRESGPYHRIHRKADQVGQGKEPPDNAFLGEVATALSDARALLLTGPGTAKTELAGYLRRHHPATAEKIWGVEAIDHPTDREIVKAARQFFAKADGMHG